jgi:hypothetical protein
MAVLSGGCTFAESAGGVLGFGFFLNKPVNPLNALSEALSILFKALLVTVLDFVFAFVAAVVTACCGIFFTDWSAVWAATRPPDISSRIIARYLHRLFREGVCILIGISGFLAEQHKTIFNPAQIISPKKGNFPSAVIFYF